MIDLVVFAVVGYLLLLPVVVFTPIKWTFKHKVLISTGAFFLTLLCLVISSVIPLYQVMVIFALLLLLSTYFLETRLRPLFLHSSNTSENHFEPYSKEKSKQEIMEETGQDPITLPKVESGVEKEGFIEEIPLGLISTVNSMEENLDEDLNKEGEKHPIHSSQTDGEELDDFELQLQDWDSFSKQRVPSSANTIPSSGPSKEEEEEYNRLFFESKN
ncbi:hypothetical protein [Bacillus sp. es.034]|uniref:hypothetical protein n=1 Tax=Bacillus sp. es.034 TaxID=1761763 RepID=UPI000BF282A3|nr:hypothetical protein [Bacillus sp. es.034]PFG05520.1 hypothetical protein ATG71_2358 [Bacillus sp. es.034]